MFRRRHTSPGQRSGQRSGPAASPSPDGAAKPTGKGRPTPKRREAERSRRTRVNPPRSRKEWGRQQREDARRRRLEARAGQLRGDERYLPARDRGPERAFLRDVVDARRSAGEFLLPGLFAVLLLSLFPIYEVQLFANALWLGMIVTLLADTTFLVRRAKRLLRERFPSAGTRGVTTYVMLRSVQIRRMRIPPPRVKRGTRL